MRFFVRKPNSRRELCVFSRKCRIPAGNSAFFRQEALSARLGGGEGRKKEARPPRKVGFFREKTEMSAKSCLRRENVCVCVFIC